MSSAGSSKQGLWENGSQGPPHHIPPQLQCLLPTDPGGQPALAELLPPEQQPSIPQPRLSLK